jgi:hypothetical protein
MFMDAIVWWDLDVSLFEQETSAMLRMFVGTLDYPSGIPDMHTIHDPMISVS